MKFWLKPAGTLLALVVIASSVAVFAGCYTVLKHPKTDVTEADYAHRDCYDCHHTDGPAQAYDPLAAPSFNYYDDALFGYYAYPWWHRNYWATDDYGYGGSGGFRDSLGFQVPVDDASRRHLWGRGGEAPPPLMLPIYGGPSGGGNAAPGGTTDPTGAPPAIQDGRTLKPGAAPAPPAPPAAPPDNKKNDKKKDDKTNVWGRGGGK